MARPLAPAIVLSLLCAPVLGADLEGRARVTLGAGFDTNARRDARQVGAVPDLLGSVVASVEGSAQFPNAQLLGSYDGGVRKFLFYPSEDVLIQAANVEASVAIGRSVGLGVDGSARDRRGGQRDYTDLASTAFLDFVPDASLNVRVYAGAHRFIYWPAFRYSFGAPEFGGSARYRLDRRHSVVAFGEMGTRTYNGMTAPNPDDPDPPAPTRRNDTVVTVGGGYAYRGPFVLTATYAYTDQTSNSFGETSRRHRLSASAAVRLPWKLYLFAQGTLGFFSYPEGFRLSPDFLLEEESENHNSLVLKLVRPISGSFDLEVRLAHHQNDLPNFDYRRQLVWAGVTWRY